MRAKFGALHTTAIFNSSSSSMEHAIAREKRIKKWLRSWKMELIERGNLRWRDLAEGLGFAPLEPTGSPRSASGSAAQPREMTSRSRRSTRGEPVWFEFIGRPQHGRL
jgi:hypothetical protein